MKKFYLLFISALAILQSHSQAFSFSFGGITRNYILHLPAGYNPATQYPLVVNMHGYSSNAAQQQLYTAMDAVADTAKFIVVYPDGINSSWNSYYNTGGVNDVGFISALIDTMQVKYNADLLRVYACGMSNGGFMTFRLACQLHNRIAAFASVTGLFADSIRVHCQNSCNIPFMDFHGTTDPIVPYTGAFAAGSVTYMGADSTIEWLVARNGCPTTPVVTNFPDINTTDGCTVTKYEYGPCQNSSEVIFYKITGGGHTWPGSFAIPPFGNTNMDIKANKEMWNFFKRHSLQCGLIGLNEPAVAGSHLLIFPNPSNGKFNVQCPSCGIKRVEVMNVLGEIIYQVSGISGSLSVDMADAPTGIYLLKAETEKGSLVQKIVKN